MTTVTGVAVAVAQAGSCNSDSTPSICCPYATGGAIKREKKKKKDKKEGKESGWMKRGRKGGREQRGKTGKTEKQRGREGRKEICQYQGCP